MSRHHVRTSASATLWTRARGQLHADRADLAVDLGGPRRPRPPPHDPGARGFGGRRGVGVWHGRRRRRPGGLWTGRLVPRWRSRRVRGRRSPQPRPEAHLAEPCGSCCRSASGADGLAGAVRLWRAGRRPACAYPGRRRRCGRRRRSARARRRLRGHRHRPCVGTGARGRTRCGQLRRRRT